MLLFISVLKVIWRKRLDWMAPQSDLDNELIWPQVIFFFIAVTLCNTLPHALHFIFVHEPRSRKQSCCMRFFCSFENITVEISFRLWFQLSSNRSTCEKETEMPHWIGDNIKTFKKVLFYVYSVSVCVQYVCYFTDCVQSRLEVGPFFNTEQGLAFIMNTNNILATKSHPLDRYIISDFTSSISAYFSAFICF